MKKHDVKKPERKNITLLTVNVDSNIFNNKDLLEISRDLTKLHNDLMNRFKDKNTPENPIKILTETEDFQFEGGFDIKVNVYQMEPLEEYQKKLNDFNKQIKTKIKKDILALQKLLKEI